MTDYPWLFDPQTATPDRQLLEALKVGVHVPVAMPQVAASMRIEQARDYIADRAIATIHATVLAERLPPQQHRTHIDIPRWASPWQHLKARWTDRWWFAWIPRRWPVQYATERIPVNLDVRAWWKYPHSPHTLLTGNGEGILHTETGSAWWGYRPYP